MTEIRASQPMNFKDRFSQAASDKRVTKQEAQELKTHIDQMQIPDADKQALNQMVDQLKDATNGQFLFFNWRSGINSEEKAGLESLAKNKPHGKSVADVLQRSHHTKVNTGFRPGQRLLTRSRHPKTI